MVVFRTAAIAILVGVLVFAWMSLFTVDERKKALVVRFGQVNRIIEKPGLYFKLPIADEVVTIEDRTFMWNSDDKAVQVSDKQRYLVDTVTLLDAALRQTYGKRTFEAALSKDRDVMMREIRDQVRGEAQALGLEIVDVRIRRTDLMAEVLEATYERMKSERLAEAKDLRGKGEALNIQMKAQADRKALELVSDANRQSEIIRGDGDAERARVFADAYQKDPEFYSFYRSMQAYAKSLAGKGTTLVLSPDSEFFKYFGVLTPKTTEPAPVQ
jgi:membrane protease subunit HflC